VGNGYRLVVACALGVAVASRAWGGPVLYDPFDYPSGGALSGNTNPQTGQAWTYVGVGGATGADPTVGSGGLSYPGYIQGSGNSVLTNRTQTGSSRITLPFSASSGTVYYSALVRVNDITNIGTATTGSFFGGLNVTPGAGGTGTSITTSGAALLIRGDASTPGIYNLGVGVSIGNPDRIFETTARSAGQTLLVVGAYEFRPGTDDDVAYLWINPDAGAFGAESAPAPTIVSNGATSTTTASDTAGPLVSFFFRNNSVEPQQIQIDELRVGTSWAEVTGVPEPGMVLLAGAGLFALLARRRTVPVRDGRFS
jgi:hypothetical protein